MRVLVLGAGGPAGVNTCKALAAHEVIAMDDNPDHLVWAQPHATEIIAGEITVENVNLADADVVIPQPDNLTLWLADHATEIEAKTFLPDRRTIAMCQDKFEAGLAWRRVGLRVDRIQLLDGLVQGFAPELPEPPFWLRARHGAGAKAAILARSKAEAKHWLSFWNLRAPYLDFIAEAYLLGRDLAWSSIWYEGDLVCSFTRERLEYIYPGLTPEGLTGTPTIAEIVHRDDANTMAEAAVHAVDEKPHGIFSVDLREDEEGLPRPTEINAGRGFTTFGLWAMESEVNLFEIILGLVRDETAEGWECPKWVFPEGLRLYRHIDCGSTLTSRVLA